MKVESDLWTQRAKEMRVDKKRLPNPTKASKMRDDYLRDIKRSNLHSGTDANTVQNVLLKMKKRGFKEAALKQRTNLNRSVDMGALPQIRRGKLEALKPEIKNNNVTIDDIPKQRATKEERDEMLSDYFSQKRRLG